MLSLPLRKSSQRERRGLSSGSRKDSQLEGLGCIPHLRARDVVVFHEGLDLRSGVQMAGKIENIPGITNTETVICMDIKQVFAP